MRQGDKYVNEKIGPNVTKIVLEDQGNYPEPEILAKHIDKHPSWQEENLEAWLDVKHEKYNEAKMGTELEINVDTQAVTKSNLGAMRDSISAQLMKKLMVGKEIRGTLAQFLFRINQPEKYEVTLNSKPLEKLWDGLRCLPYKDEEIATGLANCIMLQILRQTGVNGQAQNWESAANHCFGETVEVEFGCQDSSYSRAYVSEHDLLQAVRPDLSQFLRPEYGQVLSSGNVYGLLQLIHAPYLLFDFMKLAHLFATQISPIQVLTRNFAIFYSPARLDSFGLP